MAKATRKELLARLRHRVRHHGGKVMGGIKGTALAGGAGAIVGYAVETDAIKNIQFVKDHWWAEGALVLVAGHFAKRRASLATPAMGLCGAGGLLLAQAYKRQQGETSEGVGAVEDRVFGPAGNAGALQQGYGAPYGMGYGPVAGGASGLEESQVDAGAIQSDADSLGI